jgi:hypothetical protein
MLLQNENGMFRPDFFHFTLKRGRNVPREFIGDDRDALVRLQPKTIPDRITRPGLEFRINGYSVSAIRHGLRKERSALREK